MGKHFQATVAVFEIMGGTTIADAVTMVAKRSIAIFEEYRALEVRGWVTEGFPMVARCFCRIPDAIRGRIRRVFNVIPLLANTT